MNPPRRAILASHLIWTGYGHWLSNDPRGSDSTETRKPELGELGEVHHGRKRIQPSRKELKDFYHEAEPLLEHDTIWFDDMMRAAMGKAVSEAICKFGYTLYAFAICSNHAHAVVRTHRDRSELVWENLGAAMRDSLRASNLVANDHPAWSHRPYKVYLFTDADGIGRVDYVVKNPEKEGLPRQHWDFVDPRWITS